MIPLRDQTAKGLVDKVDIWKDVETVPPRKPKSSQTIAVEGIHFICIRLFLFQPDRLPVLEHIIFPAKLDNVSFLRLIRHVTPSRICSTSVVLNSFHV